MTGARRGAVGAAVSDAVPAIRRDGRVHANAAQPLVSGGQEVPRGALHHMRGRQVRRSAPAMQPRPVLWVKGGAGSMRCRLHGILPMRGSAGAALCEQAPGARAKALLQPCAAVSISKHLTCSRFCLFVDCEGARLRARPCLPHPDLAAALRKCSVSRLERRAAGHCSCSSARTTRTRCWQRRAWRSRTATRSISTWAAHSTSRGAGAMVSSSATTARPFTLSRPRCSRALVILGLRTAMVTSARSGVHTGGDTLALRSRGGAMAPRRARRWRARTARTAWGSCGGQGL